MDLGIRFRPPDVILGPFLRAHSFMDSLRADYTKIQFHIVLSVVTFSPINFLLPGSILHMLVVSRLGQQNMTGIKVLVTMLTKKVLFKSTQKRK